MDEIGVFDVVIGDEFFIGDAKTGGDIGEIVSGTDDIGGPLGAFLGAGHAEGECEEEQQDTKGD